MRISVVDNRSERYIPQGIDVGIDFVFLLVQDRCTQHFNKTVPCFLLHRLVATNWLQKGLHRDGLYFGAGDGARTRDSLLGRQAVT